MTAVLKEVFRVLFAEAERFAGAIALRGVACDEKPSHIQHHISALT
jgi:hypothetical protein